jgi:hypothetical protein
VAFLVFLDPFGRVLFLFLVRALFLFLVLVLVLVAATLLG